MASSWPFKAIRRAGILEAMSFGRPTIAPKVGGIPEIINDGVDGYLIPDGDVDFFTKRIIDLSNKDALEKMSAAAQKKAFNEFSSDVMAKKYYDLYSKLTL